MAVEGLARFLFFFFLCFISMRLLQIYGAADNFLINCGSNATVVLGGGRVFLPDTGSPFLALPASSVVVSGAGDGGSDLYGTARVFTAPSSYAFDLRQRGRHLVRLHLYPVESPRYDLASAVFSVGVGEITVLRGFSFARVGSSAAVLKEYVIGVDSDRLVLTLSPSDGSIAFVNAIEVISTPEGLFPSSAAPIPAGAPADIGMGRALETSYRLNVGGPLLDSKNDSLWRVWNPDLPFLVNAASARAVSVDPGVVKYPAGVSAETAPRWIYATAQEMADANVGNQKFNISWVFRVDRGFSYLVRFHFCDIVSRALYDLLFNVLHQQPDCGKSSLCLEQNAGVVRCLFHGFRCGWRGGRRCWFRSAPRSCRTSSPMRF